MSIEPGGKFFGETAEFPDDEVVSLKSKETTETKLPINPKSGPKNDIKKERLSTKGAAPLLHLNLLELQP